MGRSATAKRIPRMNPRHCLLALAHGVGTALDTVQSQRNGAIESIRETQALMLQELQKLPRAIVSALRKNGEKDATNPEP